MFIQHGGWLRKHAKWVFGVILLLLIPGFIALFTTTSGTSQRGGELPTIHGKPVNAAEFQKARRAVLAQIYMSRGAFPKTVAEEDMVDQQAVVRMILLRKIK